MCAFVIHSSFSWCKKIEDSVDWIRENEWDFSYFGELQGKVVSTMEIVASIYGSMQGVKGRVATIQQRYADMAYRQ